MLTVSPIYLGLGGLLLVALTVRVVTWRRAQKIGIGDGADKEMLRRIRVHGNAVETLPIGLLLLVACELLGVAAIWLHGFGGSLLLGRLLHAYGLSGSAGPSFGRIVGMLMTMASIVLMSSLLLWHSLI